MTALHFVGLLHPAVLWEDWRGGKPAYPRQEPSERMAYDRAVRVFGTPDFVHRRYDARAVAEIVPGDVVVFAQDVDQADVNPDAYDDSARQ